MDRQRLLLFLLWRKRRLKKRILAILLMTAQTRRTQSQMLSLLHNQVTRLAYMTDLSAVNMLVRVAAADPSVLRGIRLPRRAHKWDRGVTELYRMGASWQTTTSTNLIETATHWTADTQKPTHLVCDRFNIDLR